MNVPAFLVERGVLGGQETVGVVLVHDVDKLLCEAKTNMPTSSRE